MEQKIYDTENIIVIPDVHGRPFWKAVKSDEYKDYEMVFLGDYVDPYPTEGISEQEAIDNFKEIIDFTKNNGDRVHLLLGNHDCHYLGLSGDTCRMDTANCKTIFNLFNENRKMFNLAFRRGKTLFTHAGVTDGWLNNSFDDASVNNIDTVLNNHIQSLEWTLPMLKIYGISNVVETPVGNIGVSRGGDRRFGSCIWADATEMMLHSAFYTVENTEDNNDIKIDIELYQITGHTQLQKTGSMFHPHNNWWMCDSRVAFIWNESKTELKPLEDNGKNN